MKFQLVIVAAAVLTVAACKTTYKATDRPVPATDSTAVAMDTAMNKMPDTNNVSRIDSIRQPAPDTTQNLPKTDTLMIQPGDSAVNKTAVDSTTVSPVTDTSMTTPILDTTTKTKPEVDPAKTTPAVDTTAKIKPETDPAKTTPAIDTTTKNKSNDDAVKTTPAIDSSSASTKAPSAVDAAFTKQYPGATNVVWSHSYDSLAAVPIDMRLTGWRKMDEQDHMAKFEFENGEYYAWYDSNGKWIGSASPMTDFTALPAAVTTAVKNAIKTRYTGYSISQVNREFQTGKKSYEVELEKDDNKVRMMVSSTGKIGQIYRYKTAKK